MIILSWPFLGTKSRRHCIHFDIYDYGKGIFRFLWFFVFSLKNHYKSQKHVIDKPLQTFCSEKYAEQKVCNRFAEICQEAVLPVSTQTGSTISSQIKSIADLLFSIFFWARGLQWFVYNMFLWFLMIFKEKMKIHKKSFP